MRDFFFEAILIHSRQVKGNERRERGEMQQRSDSNRGRCNYMVSMSAGRPTDCLFSDFRLAFRKAKEKVREKSETNNFV